MERNRYLQPLQEISKYKSPSTGGIEPNKAYIASLVQSGATQNVWYTVFDVSGIGIWNYLALSSIAAVNLNLEIQITVDDESPYILNIPTQELAFGQIFYTGSSYQNGDASRKIFPNLEFLKNLKVEVRNIGVTSNLYAFASYGMVV